MQEQNKPIDPEDNWMDEADRAELEKFWFLSVICSFGASPMLGRAYRTSNGWTVKINKDKTFSATTEELIPWRKRYKDLESKQQK